MSCELVRPIKFSVLIPTRNRQELLKFAVQSVINQTYTNWEIIISDNCSEAFIDQWVETLKDTRIKYFRQETFVSVTENWNSANKMASGDYIIMLGDDDGLFPNALEALNEKINNNDYPDLVMFYAYIYVHTGVDAYMPNGNVMLAPPINSREIQPGLISKVKRREMIERCLQFDYAIGFNMQYYCYSKKLADKLKQYGNVYEPPYPDYYTSCMMLLLSEKVLYIENIITVIGVTSKSYGFYYRNNREKEGMKFHKEEDYREYAPKSVRDKLCSVDEIHTAAMATFALIPQRIDFEGPSLLDYYKQVLLRELNYEKNITVCQLMKEEMIPHLDSMQKKELTNLFIHSIIKYKTPLDTSSNRNDSMPVFHNVLELIKDMEGLKSYGLLMKFNSNYDLDSWLENIDTASLKRKMGDRKALIWGAYDRGRHVKNWLMSNDIHAFAFLDNDNSKTHFSDLPVFKPDFLYNHHNEFYIIIPLCTVYMENINLLKRAQYDFMSDYIYIGYNEKIKASNNYYDVFGNNLFLDKSYEDIGILFQCAKSRLYLEKGIHAIGKTSISILKNQSNIIISNNVIIGDNSHIMCNGDIEFKAGGRVSDHADVILEADADQKLELDEKFNVSPHSFSIWTTGNNIQIE